MKLSFLSRYSLEIALIDKTFKEVFTTPELNFFYSNSIPFHWWQKESEYFRHLILELKYPGDNLAAGYIQVLRYWLEVKNVGLI